jgi:hypothetical protein
MFVKHYTIAHITAEEYAPNRYYKLELNEKNELKYALAMDTGAPKTFYEYIYKIISEPKNYSGEKYYQDSSGKYVKETYNGFDPNVVYYSTNEELYTPISITED